jgi:CubicO group peptidase (beta-lactamase class C family)
MLIGMILERATHQSVSHFLQEKLWKPLGMEAAGSWTLERAQEDGREHARDEHASPLVVAGCILSLFKTVALYTCQPLALEVP